MPYTYSLELYPKEHTRNAEAPASDAPTEFLEDAGVTVDAALMAGDALGVNTAAAHQALDEARSAGAALGELDDEGDPIPLLVDDSLRVLHEVFTRIQQELQAAMDERGNPHGAGGARLLAAAPLIQQSPSGYVSVGPRNVGLVKLDDGLHALRKLLQTAIDSGRAVKIVW
jgi:hypothetical protein